MMIQRATRLDSDTRRVEDAQKSENNLRRTSAPDYFLVDNRLFRNVAIQQLFSYYV